MAINETLHNMHHISITQKRDVILVMECDTTYLRAVSSGVYPDTCPLCTSVQRRQLCVPISSCFIVFFVHWDEVKTSSNDSTYHVNINDHTIMYCNVSLLSREHITAVTCLVTFQRLSARWLLLHLECA